MKNMKSMKGWKIRRFTFLKPNLHVLQALHDDIPSSSCPLPWPCAVVFGLIGTTIVTTSFGGDTNWPAFRGANAAGVADGFVTPVTWNVDTSENVRFRIKTPGLGLSSPIVWGDHVFMTTAISAKDDPELKVGLYGNIAPVEDDTEHAWWLLCYDKCTGNEVWRKPGPVGVPRIRRHTKASHANSTPATDGRHIVTFFGSEGLYCYDMKGEHVWHNDLGMLDAGYFRVPAAQWGFGSSPIIHNDMVIVQCDVQKDSFIAAYNVENGEEIWRTPRTEVPTWSSPTVVHVAGKAQVVANGWKHIGAYDATTGAPVWWMRGGGDIPVPTPVVAYDLVYIMNAHAAPPPVWAVRTSAKGDITLPGGAEHIAWHHASGGSYMQTPLAYGGHLYSAKGNGVLSCYDARSGAVRYRQRIDQERSVAITASPVAGDGKIYYATEFGWVYVIKAGPTFELLASNNLGDPVLATPAISAGTVYFRTQRHLFAVANTN